MHKVKQLERVIVALENVAQTLDNLGMMQYSKIIDELTYQLDQELQYVEEALDNATE